MPDRQADPDTAAWVQTTTIAISRGDRAALACFYETWFDRSYSLARSLTGRDESFCLDVVQETMLRVIRSMKGMSTQGELSAWMAMATHSASIDLLRRESRRRRRESTAHGSRDSLANEMDERIAWIRDRIKELPAGDGTLVALRLGQGRSLEAVGAAAGMSGDAAHGRLRRAIHKLKRWVKESEHEL